MPRFSDLLRGRGEPDDAGGEHANAEPTTAGPGPAAVSAPGSPEDILERLTQYAAVHRPEALDEPEDATEPRDPEPQPEPEPEPAWEPEREPEPEPAAKARTFSDDLLPRREHS